MLADGIYSEYFDIFFERNETTDLPGKLVHHSRVNNKPL